MKHLRRVIALLLILLIGIGSFSLSFADDDNGTSKKNSESTNSLSPKKIVAILYDDSGSMRVDQLGNYKTKWFYANYAFQLFTGLLNDDDELLLTFMSSPNKILKSNGAGLLKDFSSNRQKTVDAIRKYKGDGDTPYDQIKFVGDQLVAVKDSDPTTQYWYIIIADGRFEKKPGDPKSEVGQSAIDQALKPYAGKTMSNGSECQVRFMAIEDIKSEKVKEEKKNKDKEKEPAFPSENEYVKVERCKGKGIVDVMSKIADTITGRRRLDPSEYSVEGKTLTVNSPVPVLNIQVLTQNSKAKVSSASVVDGDKLSSSSISVSTPKGDDKFKKEGSKLFGNLGTIKPKGDYIPAGKYTITFDSDVSPEDIVVMYEAALETRISIFRKGKLIEDTSVLRENEKIDIKAELAIIGTDEAIDITTLPEGMFEGLSLTIDENGTAAVSEELDPKDPVYRDYTIKNGETLITAKTILKGFDPLIAKERFTAKEPVVYGITADGNECVMRRGTIHGKKSVDFTVTGDGVPLSKADVESLISSEMISISHEEKGEKTGVRFRYDVSEDGKLHVYPKTSFLNNAFAFPRIPKGTYGITVTLDEGVSATGNFTVKGYSPIGVIITLIILAIIALLLYLFFKPHFPEGYFHSARLKYNGMDFDVTYHEDVRIGFFTDFFRIFGARTATINGMRIYAQQPNKIYISSNWLKTYIADQGEDHFGDDEYWLNYFNRPSDGTTLNDAVLDALADFICMTRPQESKDKNMPFSTGMPLLAIDNAGTENAIVSTFDFRKI